VTDLRHERAPASPVIATRANFAPSGPYPLFVAGEEVLAGDRFAAVDPSSGEQWAEVSQASTGDVERAVAAAERAFRSFRNTSPAARQELLWRIAERVQERAEWWGTLLATENGRPIREAQIGDVPATTGIFRYFSGLARAHHGEQIDAGDPATHLFTTREPLGPIAALIPWNSPLISLANKVAPALAAGNTVVLKPSELASASCLEFARLTADIVPPGVLNVVCGLGPDAGNALVSHPGIAKISFTGGPRTASAILRAAAGNLTPSILELGGKSALIVCDDADVDAAVWDAMTGIFLANGEVCFASSRLLLQDGIHDEFLARFGEIAGRIVVGDAVDHDTQMGPLISGAHRTFVRECVERALGDGATVVTGGGVPDLGGALAGGFYLEPTLLSDPDGASSLVREEIFGPVAIAERFSSVDDAVARANDTDYGLAAGIWTADLARAHRAAAGLHAGIVWVNKWFDTPQGQPQGGFRRSGFGRELSEETLLEYSAPKAVNIGLDPARPPFWG
jgi:acyl-CoA reductase-like NAD-dependent aldehyde dehydrogenase